MYKLAKINDFINKYDLYLFAQYGILHNGIKVYPYVNDVFEALKKHKKHVFVITNSGARSSLNEQRMLECGIKAHLMPQILSSGEISIKILSTEYKNKTCYTLRMGGSDEAMIKNLNLRFSDDIQKVDYIYLARLGGVQEDEDLIKDYENILQIALKKGIKMICANPDIHAPNGSRFLPSPGLLAGFYEKIGGEVIYIGKPYPLIYEQALNKYPHIKKDKIIMLGDTLETDIKGAEDIGIHSALVLSGNGQKYIKRTNELDSEPKSRQENGNVILKDEFDTKPTWILEQLW